MVQLHETPIEVTERYSFTHLTNDKGMNIHFQNTTDVTDLSSSSVVPSILAINNKYGIVVTNNVSDGFCIFATREYHEQSVELLQEDFVERITKNGVSHNLGHKILQLQFCPNSEDNNILLLCCSVYSITVFRLYISNYELYVLTIPVFEYVHSVRDTCWCGTDNIAIVTSQGKLLVYNNISSNNNRSCIDIGDDYSSGMFLLYKLCINSF
jgi:hypothetical protein